MSGFAGMIVAMQQPIISASLITANLSMNLDAATQSHLTSLYALYWVLASKNYLIKEKQDVLLAQIQTEISHLFIYKILKTKMVKYPLVW